VVTGDGMGGWPAQDHYHVIKLYKQLKRSASTRDRIIAAAERELGQRYSREQLQVRALMNHQNGNGGLRAGVCRRT
jgi:hypothetical protein